MHLFLTLAVMLYWLILLVVTGIAHLRGNRIWTRSVRKASFLGAKIPSVAAPVPLPAGALNIDSPSPAPSALLGPHVSIPRLTPPVPLRSHESEWMDDSPDEDGASIIAGASKAQDAVRRSTTWSSRISASKKKKQRRESEQSFMIFFPCECNFQ